MAYLKDSHLSFHPFAYLSIHPFYSTLFSHHDYLNILLLVPYPHLYLLSFSQLHSSHLITPSWLPCKSNPVLTSRKTKGDRNLFAFVLCHPFSLIPFFLSYRILRVTQVGCQFWSNSVWTRTRISPTPVCSSFWTSSAKGSVEKSVRS